MIVCSLLNPFCNRTKIAFLSMIRVFSRQNPDPLLADMVMSGPFDCLNAWSCSLSYSGRRGERGTISVVGLHEEEVRPVYEALDAVFKEVFPACSEHSRKDASFYVQDLMRKVYAELIAGRNPSTTEEGIQLLLFSQKVIGALCVEPLKVE